MIWSVVAILKHTHTHTQTAFLFIHCTQLFSMYDTPHCTLSGFSALLHLLQWHKSIRFSQSYGRHTCRSDGLKGCTGKDSNPNRRLLKELSPHYASMHPKAVTNYPVDIIKLNLTHIRHSSLISRVPLLELRENSALKTPTLSSQVIQWSVHHSKLSSSLFQGM